MQKGMKRKMQLHEEEEKVQKEEKDCDINSIIKREKNAKASCEY